MSLKPSISLAGSSPTIMKVKILFQRLWELKIDWDDPVSMEIHIPWSHWRSELPIISTKLIPRCYFLLMSVLKQHSYTGSVMPLKMSTQPLCISGLWILQEISTYLGSLKK